MMLTPPSELGVAEHLAASITLVENNIIDLQMVVDDEAQRVETLRRALARERAHLARLCDWRDAVRGRGPS